MQFFEAVGFKKEPFSTSPDPAFLYRSKEHEDCLQRLEISIRLRRGLNVVLGDVGTGKTTLSRTLLQTLGSDEDFIVRIVLDPSFRSEFQMLTSFLSMYEIEPEGRSTLAYKEALQNFLFDKGVTEEKTIVLIIDEGQKLTPTYIEVLRNLLNYETHEFKLLQLVIMGQMELLPRIKKMRSFMDRIALSYVLNPLNREDTIKMIQYRLEVAGHQQPKTLFTDGAYEEIYKWTQGYPRQVTTLCHNSLVTMYMMEASYIDPAIVRNTVDRNALALEALEKVEVG
jgi:general secretion pathway protein A